MQVEVIKEWGGTIFPDQTLFPFLALRRQKLPMASDTRILGSGDFVERILKEAEGKELETLRFKGMGIGIKELCEKAADYYKLELTELTSCSRRGIARKARKEIAQIAVKRIGLSGAEVACHIGVTASCINRIVGQGEICSDGEIIMKMLKG